MSAEPILRLTSQQAEISNCDDWKNFDASVYNYVDLIFASLLQSLKELPNFVRPK